MTIFVIILAGFTLANLLAFGGEMQAYRTYEFTFYSLYRSLLGADYFDEMYQVGRFECLYLLRMSVRVSCVSDFLKIKSDHGGKVSKMHILHEGVHLHTTHTQVNRFLGPLLYISWTLIGFFLLLNMFIAILNDAIEEARSSNAYAPTCVGFVDECVLQHEITCGKADNLWYRFLALSTSFSPFMHPPFIANPCRSRKTSQGSHLASSYGVSVCEHP